MQARSERSILENFLISATWDKDEMDLVQAGNEDDLHEREWSFNLHSVFSIPTCY